MKSEIQSSIISIVISNSLNTNEMQISTSARNFTENVYVLAKNKGHTGRKKMVKISVGFSYQIQLTEKFLP